MPLLSINNAIYCNGTKITEKALVLDLTSQSTCVFTSCSSVIDLQDVSQSDCVKT